MVAERTVGREQPTRAAEKPANPSALAPHEQPANPLAPTIEPALTAYRQIQVEYARCRARIADLRTQLQAAHAEWARIEQERAQAVAALRTAADAAARSQAVIRAWEVDAQVADCRTRIGTLGDSLVQAEATARGTQQRVEDAAIRVWRTRFDLLAAGFDATVVHRLFVCYRESGGHLPWSEFIREIGLNEPDHRLYEDLRDAMGEENGAAR